MRSGSHSRADTARKWLIFWTLFIGLGAVAGAAGMLADPTGKSMGMDATLPYFQKLPLADVLFQDFVFSGVALLIVNGLTNLTAACLLFARKRAGLVCGMTFGITLMLWICIQFYMFPLNFMSTIYFVFGAIQAATGYAAIVFDRQERFTVQPEQYPNVGKHPERLVVYFSRMGYVKRQAYEEANRTGAVLCELQTTERTAGTCGFWWCGRFGMHRWPMPLKPVPCDLTAYEHVTICSPIWVFALAAPIRAFCQMANGQIREADYILVHHTRGRYQSAADEMDKLLGLHRTGYRSIRCHTGRFTPLNTGKGGYTDGSDRAHS